MLGIFIKKGNKDSKEVNEYALRKLWNKEKEEKEKII
jgi:hypothetical protein